MPTLHFWLHSFKWWKMCLACHRKMKKKHRLSQNGKRMWEEKKIQLQNSLPCVWWYIKCVVHYELLEYGRTINANVYWHHSDQVNKQDYQNVYCFGKKKCFNSPQWQHEDTPYKPRSLGLEVLLYPPYSSDIKHTYSHLFRLLEYFTNGWRFRNKEVD